MGRAVSKGFPPYSVYLRRSSSSHTRFLTDSSDRIMVVLVGRPKDPTWDEVVAAASAAMECVQKAGQKLGSFREKDLSHRRGEFVALAAGISFGRGQMACRCFL